MKIIIDIDCQPTICGDCRWMVGTSQSGFACTLLGTITAIRLHQTDTRCAKRCKMCIDRTVGQA